MCRILGVTRSLVYYKHKRNKESETAIDNAVIQVFRDSRNNYGTRKLKKELEKQNIIIFHTDRGNEFKNKLIEEVLETFEIKRSLSKKGCPYDNAVAEAAFKVIKTEFAFNRVFGSLEELEMVLP